MISNLSPSSDSQVPQKEEKYQDIMDFIESSLDQNVTLASSIINLIPIVSGKTQEWKVFQGPN